MARRALFYLIIAGTLLFIGYQFYTMLYLMSGEESITVEGEEGCVIHRGKEDDDRIAFTCNVDWGEAIVPAMLDIFAEYNIKITFFVSGKWANNNPRLLRKMFLEGHEIQNHGYGHRLSSQISEEEVMEEIKKTEDAIKNFTGVKTEVFAPPSGDYDSKTVEVCREMGYLLSLWSVDTIDWRAGSTAKVIEERVLNKKLNGAILLMHPKEETVKALPGIIKTIQGRGLEIVTLKELIQ